MEVGLILLRFLRCLGRCAFSSIGSHENIRVQVGMAGTYNLLETREGDFPVPVVQKRFIQAIDSLDLRQASAMFNIPDRNIPASLLVHGMKDNVIDYNQSVNFATAL